MAYLTAKELEEIKNKKKKQQASVNAPSYLTSNDVKEILNKKNNVNAIPIKETSTSDLWDKRTELQNRMNEYSKNTSSSKLSYIFDSFTGKQAKKLAKDKKYQSMQSEYNDIVSQYEKQRVAEKQSTPEKILNTISGNVMTGVKGITSAINKVNPLKDKEGTSLDYLQSFEEKKAAEALNQTESTVGRAGLGVLGSISRMTPQMLAGNPTAATATGFSNYGGGAYNEAKNEGKTEAQATKYGLAIGTLEMSLQKALGGLSSVYGKSVLSKTTDKLLSSIIKNKNLRNLLSEASSEFSEEYLQDILNPVIRNLTMGEDNKFKLYTPEALESGILGALTSGLINLGQKSNIQSTQDTSQKNISSETQPFKAEIQTNISNETKVPISKEQTLNAPLNSEKERIGQELSTEEKIRLNKEEKITNKYNKMLKEDLKVAEREANKILYFDNAEQKNNFKELLNNYVNSNEKVSHEKLKEDLTNNFKEKVIKNIDTNLKEIKKDVRGYRIKVSDDIKHNISDYNDFRKSNFGKLKLTNDGQSVDVVYQELSNKYPGIFSPEVVHPADQLLRISEMMNESVESFEKYNLDEGTIEKATQYVENFLNNETDLNTLIESIEISPKEVRKEKVKEYRMEARDYTENLFEWNDKKLGLQYSTETMERNLYDIIPNKTEANIIVDNYIRPITESNAQKEKFIHQYNDKIGKLNLNKNESVAVQMLGEYKYNPETTLTAEQTYSFIENNKLDKKRIESAVEVFRNTYDELIVKANATLKEQGYKEIPYRKGYFPHFNNESPTSIIGKMAEKLGWKVTKNTLPTDIAGMTDIFKPGKTWFGHSLQRKGDATDYNALQGYDNYIRGTADIIYHTENIQKIRALENEIRYQYSDDGVQEQIDSIYENSDLTSDEMQMEVEKVYETLNNPMPNLVTELREYANGLANKKHSSDRAMEHDMSRKMYSVMTNVNNRVAANMVGLNVSSAFTNFIPITQAWSQVSTPNMLKAMKQSINSNYKNDGFIDKSVFLTNRVNQAERLYKTGLEKVGDKANFMFEGIDGFTANVVVRGKYLENIQKGMNESEAIKNADIFAKNVLAGRDKGSLPTVFNRKNPLTKVFTMFQLEVKNQYGYMFKDLPRDMEKEGLAKLTGAFIKMFFGAWLYNKVAESLTGRKSAFSPTDIIADITGIATDESLSASKKFSGVVEEISQDIPFIGGLVGGGRVPISAALPNVGTTVSSAATMFSEEDDAKKQTAMNNLMKELSKPVIYLVPPFGGGQAKKTIEGLGMYKKEIPGSYTTSGKLRFPVKDDIPTKAQAALFGQYASKEAREYFDENRRPLSQNQVEQMKSSKDWKETYDLILKQREYDALNNKYKKLVESGKSTKEIQKQIDNFWQK